MQHPNQPIPEPYRTSGRIRPRSTILLDGAALLSLAGYPPDQSSAHDIDWSYLTIPKLLTAFRIATMIESRRSRTALARSGTLQKYEQVVQRLTVANRQNDAYAEYRRRQQDALWASKSAREVARSALSRHATDYVIALTSLYLQLILAALPRKADRRSVLRAHKMLISRRLTHTPALLGDSCFPFESCIELARACRFLSEPPRDKGPAAIVTAPSHAKGKSGKRAVLIALHRHEKAMRRTAPNFDWRDHFWAHVRRDHFIDQGDVACIAAVMITGCRPGEIADDHSIALSAGDSDTGPILRVHITGAKLFRPSEIDTGHLPFVQQDETPQVYDTDRGQPWHQMTIACLAPEALWLHGHVLKYGSIADDSMIDHPTGFPTSIRTSCLYQSLRDPGTRRSARWLPPSERRRRAVVSFSKTISRIGKLAFPKLGHSLTAYVFRHALVTDMRASGRHGDHEIPQALGHLSMRSMSRYGTPGPKKPGIRANAIIDITAPLPPRPRQEGFNRALSAAVRTQAK